MSRLVPRALRLLALLLALSIASCAGGRGAEHAQTPLAELRRVGPTANDAELVGEWLLLEMISPGGEPKSAAIACWMG